MCLSAIYWARIKHIYYAATRKDAALAGFDDQHIYDEIPLKEEDRSLPIEKVKHSLAEMPFEKWKTKEDKTRYSFCPLFFFYNENPTPNIKF